MQKVKRVDDREGQGFPPRYDKKRHPGTVGRGPVPRRASRNPTRAGQAPALR